MTFYLVVESGSAVILRDKMFSLLCTFICIAVLIFKRHIFWLTWWPTKSSCHCILDDVDYKFWQVIGINFRLQRLFFPKFDWLAIVGNHFLISLKMTLHVHIGTMINCIYNDLVSILNILRVSMNAGLFLDLFVMTSFFLHQCNCQSNLKNLNQCHEGFNRSCVLEYSNITWKENCNTT